MTRSADVAIFSVLSFIETSHLERYRILTACPCKQQSAPYSCWLMALVYYTVHHSLMGWQTIDWSDRILTSKHNHNSLQVVSAAALNSCAVAPFFVLCREKSCASFFAELASLWAWITYPYAWIVNPWEGTLDQMLTMHEETGEKSHIYSRTGQIL